MINKKLHLIGSVCIINDNKVLFLKRTPEVHSPNVWSLPGGHVEDKESFFQAALREVREETNLDVQVERIIDIVRLSQKNREFFMVFFIAHLDDVSKLKVDGKENDEFCWLDLEEIQNSKIDFRHKLLKDAAIKSLTQKSVPVEVFSEYLEDKN